MFFIHTSYSLSSVLLSEFTLELHRRNSAPAANSISLPPIRSIPDVLQRIHQSVLVEMGDSRAEDAGDRDNIPGILPPDSVAQSPNSSHPENESVHVSV